MANRLSSPTLFAGLAPLWSLSYLDANATNAQSFANDSSLGYVNGIPLDTGVANAYSVMLPFGSPTAYQDGMTVAFIPSNSNNGPSTITVSPLGSVSILNPAGLTLNGGELTSNQASVLIYKSAAPTGFRIIGPCSTLFTGATSAGGQTFNCAGYSNVTIIRQPTVAATASISLQNLGIGVPFFIIFQNASGVTEPYGIQLVGGTHSFYTLTQNGGTILNGDFNSSFLSVLSGFAIRVWGTNTGGGGISMQGILG